MRIFLTFFWVILGFLILYIFSQNVGQTVAVDLLFVSYDQVNLITVTFVCLFLGFILGAVFLLLQIFKSRKEKNVLKRQIRLLQEEVDRLKEKTPESDSEEAPFDDDMNNEDDTQ